MSPYEIIMVVIGIISAVLSALTIGYKFGQKKVNRRPAKVCDLLRPRK